MLSVLVLDACCLERIGKFIVRPNPLLFKFLKLKTVARLFDPLDDLYIRNSQIVEVGSHLAIILQQKIHHADQKES